MQIKTTLGGLIFYFYRSEVSHRVYPCGGVAGNLYLNRSFSLDFNLGLGYTNLEYDSFTISNETRVYKAKDQIKNFWGPTQAGVSLIWTIGGSK